MKNILLKGLCLILFCSCSPKIIQLNEVKGKGYQGYIFSAGYNSRYLHFDNAVNRFTPTAGEIDKAERLLKNKLAEENTRLENQGGTCPVITEYLSKYVRQYFGYVQSNGDKIIWINFIGGKERHQRDKLAEELVVMLDGCSYYWNIKINLNSERLYDLNVNGAS